MCGILGTINFRTLQNNEYKPLMIHRGPDDQSHLKIKNLNLYHFRLSIQDLSIDANQPFTYDENTIVFNGEIYNHLSLREKYGLNCRTSSDTETVLQLYDLLGIKMLEEFDGMFAFAIYDSKKKSLILGRDRAGKKPLYYYKNDNLFVFASELNSIKAIIPLNLNNDVINDYFFIGSQFQKNTVYKGVHELKNGHCIEVNTESLNIKEFKWWDILDAYKKKKIVNFNEAKEQVTSLLDIAVKRRLESSDLEVGTFLSGGIDSGLVTAFASKYVNKLKTFTVAFDGTYNEAPLAKLVAEKFKTDHTEIQIDFSNLRSDFESIISNYGEPFFDSSAIPSYYVSKEAKKHVTVILNGDGADELLGGYRRYVPFSKIDLFNTPKVIKNINKTILKALPVAHNKTSYYNYIYRLLKLNSQSGINTYLSTTTDIFTGFESYFKTNPKLLDIKRVFNETCLNMNNGLDKIMYMDFATLLFGDLLVKMDIATMAHSLEGRSPFLSKELLDLAPRLSSGLKVNGKTTKYLLRQIAKETLPKEIFNQPKRGFEIPLKKWIDGSLKEILEDNLQKPNAIHLDFIDKKFVRDLKNRKVNVSDEKRAKMLYSILCLEVWHNTL